LELWLQRFFQSMQSIDDPDRTHRQVLAGDE
jgi:hypothetical protein